MASFGDNSCANFAYLSASSLKSFASILLKEDPWGLMISVEIFIDKEAYALPKFGSSSIACL